MLSDKSARTTPARLDRVRRTARRRLRGLHQWRLLILRHVFLKCAASRGARRSALTEVVPALRRPRWSAPVRRRAPPKRFRDVDYAMRTQSRQDLHHKVSSTRPATPNLQGLPRRRNLNVPRRPWHGEWCAILGIRTPARWCQVVELALYTVEGRQAGDLRRKCGSVLIRKAKTRRAFE